MRAAPRVVHDSGFPWSDQVLGEMAQWLGHSAVGGSLHGEQLNNSFVAGKL